MILSSASPRNESFNDAAVLFHGDRRDYSRRYSNIVDYMTSCITCVLVAEPGMGKTDFLNWVSSLRRANGEHTSFVSLFGFDSPSAAGRMLSALRRGSSVENEYSLVCFDDCPPLSESDCIRVSKAIERFSAAGRSVLIAMRPEASVLLDSLDDALVLGGDFLRIDPSVLSNRSGMASSMSNEELMQATRGIPGLLDDLNRTRPIASEACEEAAVCDVNLRHIVRESLRHGLISEERVLRFAMILLGSGTTSDLQFVLGDVPDDLLGALSQRAPFFGVTHSAGAFSCPRISDLQGLLSCVADLVPISCEFREVAFSCAELLVRRADFARAGVILRRLCEPEASSPLVLEWPLEFINAGEQQLVRQCATVGKTSGASVVPGSAAASIFLAWVDGGPWASDNHLVEPEPDACPRACAMRLQTKLVSATHSLACGMCDQSEAIDLIESVGEGSVRELPPGLLDDGSSLTRGLALHAAVWYDLLSGRVERAFERMLVAGIRRDGRDLVSSLLADDFYLVRGLMGDRVTPEDERHVVRARRFYLASGMAERESCQTVQRRTLALLCGGAESQAALDVAIGRCNREGLRAHESVLLLAGAMSDLRGGSFLRARVRAMSSYARADGAGLSFVARQAGLVRLAAEIAMGASRKSLEAACACFDENSDQVTGFMRSVAYGHGTRGWGGSHSTELAMSSLPVLSLLVRDCSAMSELSSAVLPAVWESQVERFRAATRERYGMALKNVDTDAQDAEKNDALHIKLLGGFEASRSGVVVPEAAWKRKKGRTLLALLAVTEGHELTRAAAIAALWPDCDYVLGRDRLYVTLGALRKALGHGRGSSQYVCGTDGRLWLDEKNVVCDIDEFDAACDEALGCAGDDTETIRRCLLVRDLYVGDVVQMSEASGSFVARREEERRRFTSVMAVGAEASLRQGEYVRAEWFARAAYRADPLREDVAELEIRALFAQGRRVEAKVEYERYAKRLIEKTGMPPTAALRRMVGELGSGRRGPIGRISDSDFGEGA